MQSSLEAYNNAKQPRRPTVRDSTNTSRGNLIRNRLSTYAEDLYSGTATLTSAASSGEEFLRPSAVAASSSSSTIYPTSDIVASSFAETRFDNPAFDDGRTGEVNVDAFAASEYPDSVTELVMNGFELARVLRAYDLVGDNFDDLLAFLMSNG